TVRGVARPGVGRAKLGGGNYFWWLGFGVGGEKKGGLGGWRGGGGGRGPCSPARAPSRRLWRWPAFHSPPSPRSFRPAHRSCRPATSPVANASASSALRRRSRSRAPPPLGCRGSKRRPEPPRPNSSSDRFASSARRFIPLLN